MRYVFIVCQYLRSHLRVVSHLSFNAFIIIFFELFGLTFLAGLLEIELLIQLPPMLGLAMHGNSIFFEMLYETFQVIILDRLQLLVQFYSCPLNWRSSLGLGVKQMLCVLPESLLDDS
jgi:hypothetical protein